MIVPMASKTLFLTTVGNHESDFPNSASLPYGRTSGGECGVIATTLIPQPAPAVVNKPWWSYDVGLIHFVGMSTEHDFSIGSDQHTWLENDLKEVNRTATPWVIFSGHRPMYVNSDDCCANYYDDDCVVCADGTDLNVMMSLQSEIEPILYKYKVNLAFAGHFHDVQRQSAVYQNKVVQAASIVKDSDGNSVAFHDNPEAPVWMVIGSAGNGPHYANKNYSWSEKYWEDTYGYAIVIAENETVLKWQFINSANNMVLDRMTITQSLQDLNVPRSTSSRNTNEFETLPSFLQALLIVLIIFTSGCFALFIGKARRFLICDSVLCRKKHMLLDNTEHDMQEIEEGEFHDSDGEVEIQLQQ